LTLPSPRRNPQSLERLSQFKTHLAARKLSVLTIKSYTRDIEALIELAQAATLESLDVHAIRRYIAILHSRGLSGRSLARMLSAWRSFFSYLARDHACTTNPCAGLRAPKAKKTLPSALSPDHAAQLMKVEGEGALPVRDRAMHELFYSSGLRLAELKSLTPEDLTEDGMVRVTGKGNKTRIVPVGSRAREALAAWLETRAKIIRPGETALFLNSRGTRLSQRAVQSRLKWWARKLGLAQNVHPHMLRHSFASHVLQSSGDLRAVQEMLGHASIASTQVYSHLDFQAMAKVYDAAHPRAKRKKD
jgi:integrase/recombinase XerC